MEATMQLREKRLYAETEIGNQYLAVHVDMF